MQLPHFQELLHLPSLLRPRTSPHPTQLLTCFPSHWNTQESLSSHSHQCLSCSHALSSQMNCLQGQPFCLGRISRAPLAAQGEPPEIVPCLFRISIFTSLTARFHQLINVLSKQRNKSRPKSLWTLHHLPAMAPPPLSATEFLTGEVCALEHTLFGFLVVDGTIVQICRWAPGPFLP